MHILPCLRRQDARGLFALRRRTCPAAQADFLLQFQRRTQTAGARRLCFLETVVAEFWGVDFYLTGVRRDNLPTVPLDGNAHEFSEQPRSAK